MRNSGSIVTLGLVAALAATTLQADTVTSDGYSLDDFQLRTANDLVDVCTIEASHVDHTVATAFCYGFFEGATHYDEAIEDTPAYVDIVCSPKGTTRTQGVAVFVEYIRANPQYGSEAPIDVAFRALSARWPCPG